MRSIPCRTAPQLSTEWYGGQGQSVGDHTSPCYTQSPVAASSSVSYRNHSDTAARKTGTDDQPYRMIYSGHRERCQFHRRPSRVPLSSQLRTFLESVEKIAPSCEHLSVRG